MKMHHRFIESLHWNTLGAALYFLIFMINQSVLFACIDRATYGVIGTVFSSAYLLVGLLDGGLDASFSPFLSAWSTSQKSFRTFMGWSVSPTFLISVIALGALYCLKPFQSAFSASEYRLLFLLVSCIVLLEMMRKALRIILQLVFKNKMFAFGELVFIGLYSIALWTPYLVGKEITVWNIFGSLAGSSLVTCVFLAYGVYRWYQTLDKDTHSQTHLSLSRVARTRLSAWVHYSATSLFSSNFLVPVFAARFGFVQAAVFKLIGTIVQSTVSIIKKVFAASGSALFAHTRYETRMEKTAHFSLALGYLYQCIYMVFIFVVINHTVLSKTAPVAPTNIFFIIMTVFLNLAEMLLVLHEQYFITNEKAELLALFNLSLCAISMMIIYGFPFLSPAMALGIITVLRITACLAVTLISVRRWSIGKSLYPRMGTVAFSVFVSALFLIFSNK